MCTCLAWLPLVSDKVILYENCKKVWLHLLLCIIWNTANCASWWHYYEFVLNGSWVSLSFFGAYVCCVVTGLPECTQTCMLPLPVLTLTEISSFGQTRTAWICLWPGHSSRSVTNGCHKGHSLVSRTIQSTWELCNGHNTVMQPRMEEKWENSVGLVRVDWLDIFVLKELDASVSCWIFGKRGRQFRWERQQHKKHKGQQEQVWCTRVKCQFTWVQIVKGPADQNQIWMSQWLVNALCVFFLGFSQEYSPELQAISKRGKSSVTTGEGGITITSIRHSREDSYGSYNADQPPSYSTTQRNSTAISSSTAAPGTGNRCVHKTLFVTVPYYQSCLWMYL